MEGCEGEDMSGGDVREGGEGREGDVRGENMSGGDVRERT